jgi:dipeptide transport system permease protein
MLAYFLRRILLTIPTFVALMFATFVAIRLVPGDPVETRMGEHGITPERLAMLRHQLGLDLPVWRQFLAYVAIAAVKRGSYFDQALMSVATIGYSMPIFWWGLLLIMFVAVDLGLTPVSGRIDLIQYYFEPVTGFMTIDALLSDQSGAFLDALHHLILPAIVLGTVPLAVIARMTRSSMLEVLSEDYVRTARAKGLSPLRVVGLHALRNALLPVVTMVGLQVSSLLAGAVLTETIFSWPGIGKWLIESIGRRDYPALQGGVMLVSLVVIMVNVLVDLLYGAINPRIRHGR